MPYGEAMTALAFKSGAGTEIPAPEVSITVSIQADGSSSWSRPGRSRGNRRMTHAERPLWAKQESVEARADAGFAFRHWTCVENMAADPGIERVETDQPYRDRPGLRGTTHLTGGGTVDWLVTEVDAGRRVVIDIALREAVLRFEMRFDDGAGGGSLLTQRVSLFGPGAAAYLQEVEAGFATSLRDGMRAVRDRIDEAAAAGR